MTGGPDHKATLNLPRTDFAMKANLPDSEPRRLERWKASGLYGRVRAARRRDGRPSFTLHDGPPYANGSIHLGHIVNKTLKDIVLRSHSMLGRDVAFPPVWDCHGLPIELQVDRALGSKKRDLDAVAFRKACRAHAQKYVQIQSGEFQRLGVYGDWDNPFFTMHPVYQATIVRRLADFVEGGLVYKAKKSVHWCISCRTALAEAEIEYDENHESPSIDVLFPVSDASRAKALAAFAASVPKVAHLFAIAWTTTPWTIPANMALAVHPDAEYALVRFEGGDDAVIVASALLEAVSKRVAKGGRALGEVLGRARGADLVGLVFRHPWIDRNSPVLPADYVTLDTGTGIVHTAPGHGWDDYLTGVKHGLDIYCPVDEAGRFTSEVPEFEGVKVFDANPKVIDLLRERGRLAQTSKYSHSYPLCWRCKNPVIFRATPQWFIGLDEPLRGTASSFRARALDEIAATRWFPAWGQDRIHNMVALRPDWCISRQRLWGVPIPAFYCDGCGEAHLRPDLLRRVADRFEAHPAGADAWWSDAAAELLPPGFRCPKCSGASFSKERDILDVWFDSGSLHSAIPHHPVEAARQSSDADLYLEGSDQHRGWFHSSLLVSVGTRGKRPFAAVLTHGFTMDGEGRKMSKSLGNVIEADKAMKQYGADVLRLWVAMVDYREDMRISEEILKRVAEAYRKIRNTCRFMLSNLFDFDVAAAVRGALNPPLESLDAYALARHAELEAEVRAAYAAFEYHTIYHRVTQYCSVDLSAFYLDVLKDRLYCDAPGTPRRLSAQYALYRITDSLARLVAPLMPFTADEIHEALHAGAAGPGDVHVREFPEPAPAAPGGPVAIMTAVVAARAVVTKAIEEARDRKDVASSQEAAIVLEGSAAALEPLRAYEREPFVHPGPLAGVFLVSGVTLREAPGDLRATVTRAGGAKCPRCWNYHSSGAELCPRCEAVVASLAKGSRN